MGEFNEMYSFHVKIIHFSMPFTKVFIVFDMAYSNNNIMKIPAVVRARYFIN